MQTDAHIATPDRLKASVWVFVTLAGVSSGLTLLFLGMRSVMEIGGACAEGGPFVPVRPCPKGIPLVMIGSIWGGLVFAGLYAWQSLKRGIPNFLALLWPALFLSLGWNFLEFGLDPPGEGGLEWGWLVCAVVFGLMGGIPLLIALPLMARRFAGASPSPPSRGVEVARALRSVGGLRSAIRAARDGPAGTPERDRPEGSLSGSRPESAPATGATSTGDPSGLVSLLERLEALHRSGGLDDQEYEAAKRRVLSPEEG